MRKRLFEGGLCPNGHVLTGRNIKWDRCANSRGGLRLRCRSCINAKRSRYQKAKYQRDARYRAISRAYRRWWNRGDPQGRTWSEIKAGILAVPAELLEMGS